MTKVFISLPMRGRSDEEIRERMNHILKVASDRLKDELELIDTVIEDEKGETAKHGCYYLGRSISMMSNADFVIFDHDWKSAKGCRIERWTCNFYNIPYYTVMEDETWSCDITVR